MDAIVTSTKRAAECMGIDKEVGTLEPGREADLLVLDGDPLQDIGLLRRERPALVMQGGRPVAGPLQRAFVD